MKTRESPGRSLWHAPARTKHTGKPMDTTQSHGQTDAPGQPHATQTKAHSISAVAIRWKSAFSYATSSIAAIS